MKYFTIITLLLFSFQVSGQKISKSDLLDVGQTQEKKILKDQMFLFSGHVTIRYFHRPGTDLK